MSIEITLLVYKKEYTNCIRYRLAIKAIIPAAAIKEINITMFGINPAPLRNILNPNVKKAVAAILLAESPVLNWNDINRTAAIAIKIRVNNQPPTNTSLTA